ncbi:MAG: hypothetical protein J0H91_19040 [Rhodospirillales bacterium]|nr:hypothetical protein [Rhodospirillales bacterium]
MLPDTFALLAAILGLTLAVGVAVAFGVARAAALAQRDAARVAEATATRLLRLTAHELRGIGMTLHGHADHLAATAEGPVAAVHAASLAAATAQLLGLADELQDHTMPPAAPRILREEAIELGADDVPEMLALVDGYFSTLQQNTGILHTRFDPACRRRENGVWTTLSSDPNAPPTMRMTCAESFQLGFFRPNERVRGRRTPLVDERTGLVLAGAFIDHSGRITEYELTDGRTLTSGFLRPHTYAMLELFKIVAGSITAIEAVFHPVPYGMRGAWVEEELSAPPRRS